MTNNEKTRNVLRAGSLLAMTLAGLSALWRAMINAESDAAYVVSWFALGLMVTILAATLLLGVQVVRRHMAKRRARRAAEDEVDDGT